VVEDNPADADLVRELLRDARLVAEGAVEPEVHLVDTLRGALAAARRPFDVALLDLGLPDANGLEGLTALSAEAPELPAVVLTCARDPNLAARALVAGAEDFLVKGEIEGELLLRSLRFAVARHRRGSSRRPLLAARGRGDREAAPGGQVSHPAAATATSYAPGQLATRAAPRGNASARRVLLVEDNPGDAELVRIALSEGPGEFVIQHVERLGDALAALSSRQPDVVLLDLCLPDAAGMTCVAGIREAAPELPIVVLTGEPGVGLEAVRAGVQEYVVKGELDLEAQGLQRAIDYAIERSSHGQRVRELAAERAAHAATQAAAGALRYANERLALATREAHDALEREAAARSEAERRRREIEALFTSMIDPVLVLGADRRIESTNPAVARLFGFDPRGLTPAEFIDAADMRSDDGARMPPSALPSARALDGAIVPSERVHVHTPAGKRVLLVSASPVWRGDSVQGAVCVYRDVTDQDRAEQALRESDERKDHFLAMLAHELRNPLAPIVNGVYILERTAPGDQARRALGVIDRQVHHLSRLVDDLLDVTRITRGKINLRLERIDVSALVRHAAEDQRSVFADRGVELEVAVGATPLQVSADPTRIAQVIGNLLHNAVKFTPRGGRVSLSAEGAGEGFAAIRVRDTGEGIAPATLGRIFEPFVQGDRALDRKHGGLGLGLALVKGLAELHGGAATAHSEGAGKGAEFVITLPLCRAAERSPGSGAPALTVPAHRILLIEDNVDGAESLKEALEMNGHVVEIAHSGPEGLEKARASHPDVVLCDIGLPVMDGFEVAMAMRADPALGSIAIIALSGYAAPADLERAAGAGFDRHLAKPVDWAELERVMSEVAALRAALSSR
jgi:signal transduction histidine kinase/DNA-binding response OmpR family regulator